MATSGGQGAHLSRTRKPIIEMKEGSVAASVNVSLDCAKDARAHAEQYLNGSLNASLAAMEAMDRYGICCCCGLRIILWHVCGRHFKVSRAILFDRCA